jgi:hypothetical protein
MRRENAGSQAPMWTQLFGQQPYADFDPADSHRILSGLSALASDTSISVSCEVSHRNHDEPGTCESRIVPSRGSSGLATCHMADALSGLVVLLALYAGPLCWLFVLAPAAGRMCFRSREFSVNGIHTGRLPRQ